MAKRIVSLPKKNVYNASYWLGISVITLSLLGIPTVGFILYIQALGFSEAIKILPSYLIPVATCLLLIGGLWAWSLKRHYEQKGYLNSLVEGVETQFSLESFYSSLRSKNMDLSFSPNLKHSIHDIVFYIDTLLETNHGNNLQHIFIGGFYPLIKPVTEVEMSYFSVDITPIPPLVSSYVRLKELYIGAIFRDKDGNIWHLNSRGGLSRIKAKSVISVFGENSQIDFATKFITGPHGDKSPLIRN